MVLNLNADGACVPNPGQGSFGVVARAHGRVLCRFGKRIGLATNNEAEWRAAIAALDYALAQCKPYSKVELRMDSQLVVNQLTGRYRCKSESLRPFVAEGQRLLGMLRGRVEVSVMWVPREQNAMADAAAERRL